ncbi:MAG: alpha-glucosidase [Bacteroidota bacterium]
MEAYWWREAVVYQVYPRSFCDGNGDGIGDLPGIISRLDYIKSLGVDAIWINPFFKSPNDDGGYDISDYFDVLPEFGTLADVERLLEEAHFRGLKVIIDLVFNHSSDEHEWFTSSRTSKDNPYRDFYFWREGRGENPPSNWPSFFGGSAWEKDQATGEYYLHLFSRKQPDLNWENPAVRNEIHRIIRFWLEKGVDGIRLDVISAISKRTGFPDADTTDFNEIIARYYANGPRMKEYIAEMRKEVFTSRTILTVGEGPGINPGNAMDYLSEDNGLDMIFHFGHMFLDQGPGGRFDPVSWSLDRFRKVFKEWDDALYPGGWGSVFLGNHDFARQVSRWGNDGDHREMSAKALLTLLLTLRGTPFIFAGDEIGMTNLKLDAVSESRDVETINGFKVAAGKGMTEEEFLQRANYSGRDNARSPFQWDDGQYAGFSTMDPWMKVNPNKEFINVKSQDNDQHSILNYFRQLVSMRKSNKGLIYGDMQLHETGNVPLMAFDRVFGDDRYRIIISFSNHQVNIPVSVSGCEVILSNASLSNDKSLQPWQAIVLRMNA